MSITTVIIIVVIAFCGTIFNVRIYCVKRFPMFLTK